MKKAKNGTKDDRASKKTEKESEETDKKGRFIGWIRDCGGQKRQKNNEKVERKPKKENQAPKNRAQGVAP